jgi:hypothetical protein
MRFSLTTSATVAGRTVRVLAGGSVDEASGEGAVTMSVAGTRVSALMRGGYVYVRVPAGATSPLTGGRRWIRADARAYTEAFGSGDPLAQGATSPGRMLAMIAAGGQVQDLGSETVRGVDTRRYHAEIDFGRYAQSLPEPQRGSAERYVATLTKLTGSSLLPVDVWLDGEQRVRRFATQIRLCSPAGPITDSVTEDIYGYGPQPAVQVPSAGEATDITGVLRAQLAQTLTKLSC